MESKGLDMVKVGRGVAVVVKVAGEHSVTAEAQVSKKGCRFSESTPNETVHTRFDPARLTPGICTLVCVDAPHPLS